MAPQRQTTQPPSTSGSTRIDRYFSWTLDLEGDIYGDERERLRWYEGIAISASAQWILIPWVLAVMAWICSPETVPYLWVFWIVTSIPQYLALFYVSRKRVDVSRITWNRKRIIVTLLTVVPLFVFLAGMTAGLDLRASGEIPREALLGGAVGALCGGAAAGIAVRSMKRRQARRLMDAEVERDAADED